MVTSQQRILFSISANGPYIHCYFNLSIIATTLQNSKGHLHVSMAQTTKITFPQRPASVYPRQSDKWGLPKPMLPVYYTLSQTVCHWTLLLFGFCFIGVLLC